MRLISIPFLTSLLLVSAVANDNASSVPTDAEQLESFECRCGVPTFLEMPHTNITDPLETGVCSRYSKSFSPVQCDLLTRLERVELLDARGTEEPQGVSTMFLPVAQTILQKVPGGASLPVEYPAVVDQDTSSGERFVVDTINQGLGECPDQKYVLFGYSQGVALILRALSQLINNAKNAVSSVTLFGSPYRLPGKLSNVNGTGQPSNEALVGLLLPATETSLSFPAGSTRVARFSTIVLR
jgi:hypothetical protein